MSLLARLFASPKTVTETVRSAVRGLDDIVYTEQERAEKTQQAQELYGKMWMAALPSALSRRLIACIFVATWAILVLTGVGLYAFGIVEAAEFTFRVLREIVLQPVNIIVGFYFLKQVVAEYRSSP